MILCHPKDIETKPGSSVEFFIEISRTAIAHEWHFQEQTISSDNTDYRGPTTEHLTIAKCLPKHKGAYKCVVTDESGKTFTSESATLTIGRLAFVYKLCVYQQSECIQQWDIFISERLYQIEAKKFTSLIS